MALHITSAAALAAVLIAVFMTGASSVNVTTCYLFPTRPSDMGFTYINSNAVRSVTSALQKKYPSVNLAQIVRTNQLLAPNMTATIIDLIENHSCNIILACSSALVGMLPGGYGPLSALYPSVYFWVFSLPYALSKTNPPNVIGAGGDITPTWFRAGAAAAVECSSCVGVMVPFPAQRGTINAFYRGMKFGEQFRGDGANVTELCPVVGVELGSFSNVPAEVAFAQQMKLRGCSIVAIFSDNYNGAKYIQQSQPSSSTIYSITGNTNGALVVGDTVLTSVFYNFHAIFMNVTESLILQKPILNGMLVRPTLGDISPLAKFNATLAVQAAQQLLATNVSALWCEPLYNQSGYLYNQNGSCITFAQYASLNVLALPLVQYGQFPSPTQCPPGTMTVYAYSGNLALQCTPCPLNTVSSVSGSSACVPCPNGTLSTMNSSMCDPIVIPGSNGMPLGSLLALCIILPVAVIIGLLVLYASRRSSQSGGTPPPESPLAFAVLDVDADRSSGGWRKQMLSAAYIFEFFRASVVGVAQKHDAYIVFASPTTFLVAAKTVKQAFLVAEDVEGLLCTHSYQSTCIAIRAVVHYGEAICIHGGSESRRARYVGPAIDTLLEVNKEAQARQGQIILTEPALEALRQFDSTATARITNTFTIKPGTAASLRCVRVLFKATQCLPRRDMPTSVRRSSVEEPRNAAPQASTGLALQKSENLLLSVKPHQRQGLQTICLRTLQVFLGVLKPEEQEQVSRKLLDRFRIFLPGDVRQGDIVQHVCHHITPDLVSTMDELHLQDQIKAINNQSFELPAALGGASSGRRR